MQILSPVEFKFAPHAGEVSGYAAVFGNKDLGGDVLLPGAVKSASKTRDGFVLLLYQHRQDLPIGKAEVTQDEHGLAFKARLMDDPIAARAHSHVKEGVLDGVSIGYTVLNGGVTFKDDHRELSAIHLMEISLVTFPMNPLARVEGVKTALECQSPRELEHLLRESPQFRFSSRKAKAAANALWPLLSDARDEHDDVREEREVVLAFAECLKHLNVLLERK